MDVKRTERGWAGHFICAPRCRFRRNTLLEYGNIKIVVSSVGLMETIWKEDDSYYKGRFEEIGFHRYYETMAFHSNTSDSRYHDANVTKEISFSSPWSITEGDADDKANDMHEQVVREITEGLLQGKTYNKEG